MAGEFHWNGTGICRNDPNPAGISGASIRALHTAPFATPTAPAYGSALAPAPPPPVTPPLPVPFAHVTPGCKTRFYSVTVGKCCGVFSNW